MPAPPRILIGRLGTAGAAGAEGDILKGFNRLAGPDAGAPIIVVGTGVDPAAEAGLLALNEDQGRQTMSPIAKSPAAMPIATRADLKTVWLRFSSRIAAEA